MELCHPVVVVCHGTQSFGRTIVECSAYAQHHGSHGFRMKNDNKTCQLMNLQWTQLNAGGSDQVFDTCVLQTINFCPNSLKTFSRSTLMSLSHHTPFNGPNGPPVGLDVTNLVTQATSTRGGLAQLPSTEGSGTAQAQTSNTKTATPKYAQVRIGKSTA